MGNGFWARPPTSGPGSPHPCHRAMRGTIPRWPHPYFPSAGRPASTPLSLATKSPTSNPVPASPSTVPPAKHRPAECGRERWKSGRVVATIREIGRFRRRRAPILWGFFPDCALAKPSRPVTDVTGSSRLLGYLVRGRTSLEAKRHTRRDHGPRTHHRRAGSNGVACRNRHAHIDRGVHRGRPSLSAVTTNVCGRRSRRTGRAT
jgi:hypothetical protein